MACVTLWSVVTLVFILFNVLPDPARQLMGQRSDAIGREAIVAELGLDKTPMMRYVLYLNDLSPISFHMQKQTLENYDILFQAQFGQNIFLLKKPYLKKSFQSKKPVNQIIAEAFTGTFFLAVLALLIAVVSGIPLGILAALNFNKITDRLILFFATIGISVPSFFSAILIAWLFGYLLHDFTGLNMTGSLYAYDFDSGLYVEWRNVILPSIALGIRPLAIITQLTRSSMLEVLTQDYIRTAYAKGLNRYQVIKKHALRNALNPVITSISGWFASMLAGAFFIEYIFNWHGIGKVTVEALDKADYPVVTGMVLLIAVIFITVNLFVDWLYKRLDPRVQ